MNSGGHGGRGPSQLLDLAKQYAKTKPAKQKDFLEKTLADAKGREKHIHSGFSFHSEHIAKIDDPAFVALIKAYYDKTDGWFGFIEELRMNLAKHEVPKSRRLVAEMPGYARIDIVRSKLYWQFIDAQGGTPEIGKA